MNNYSPRKGSVVEREFKSSSDVSSQRSIKDKKKPRRSLSFGANILPSTTATPTQSGTPPDVGQWANFLIIDEDKRKLALDNELDCLFNLLIDQLQTTTPKVKDLAKKALQGLKKVDGAVTFNSEGWSAISELATKYDTEYVLREVIMALTIIASTLDENVHFDIVKHIGWVYYCSLV